MSERFSFYEVTRPDDITPARVTVFEHELQNLMDAAEQAGAHDLDKSQLVHFDRFSSYGLEKQDGKMMAVVPESELQSLLEFANLAEAASPAHCDHPADSLEAFELIADCCVCPECGAVLKNYGLREASALGINPGWTKLNAQLLSAEILRALMPAFNLLDYIQSETSQYGKVSSALSWGEAVGRDEVTRKLERVS